MARPRARRRGGGPRRALPFRPLPVDSSAATQPARSTRGRRSPRSPRARSGSASERWSRRSTFRPVSVLAKSVVTVDHISGGRVELGIGAGWFEPDHDAYGFPFGTVGERMTELERQLAGDQPPVDDGDRRVAEAGAEAATADHRRRQRQAAQRPRRRPLRRRVQHGRPDARRGARAPPGRRRSRRGGRARAAALLDDDDLRRRPRRQRGPRPASGVGRLVDLDQHAAARRHRRAGRRHAPRSTRRSASSARCCSISRTRIWTWSRSSAISRESSPRDRRRPPLLLHRQRHRALDRLVHPRARARARPPPAAGKRVHAGPRRDPRARCSRCAVRGAGRSARTVDAHAASSSNTCRRARADRLRSRSTSSAARISRSWSTTSTSATSGCASRASSS